ncbi:MAG: tetratricopeptide repeat protein [Rikenellaceae bacterium]
MSTINKAETPEAMESIGEAMSKTELFFENNGKVISYGIFGLLLVAAVIFGYKTLIVEPKMEQASEMILNAQSIFEQSTPDYDAALNGNDSGAGFLEVIENYGSTPAGNLAAHYAGICYIKLGDLDNAAKYLAQYKAVESVPASIINAQNLGLQADIAVDKGDYTSAMNLYNKAIAISDNSYTAPLYMYKSALVAIETGDNAKATELLEKIISNYPNAVEARSAEKYLGTIK